jgi:hypothetical protein
VEAPCIGPVCVSASAATRCPLALASDSAKYPHAYPQRAPRYRDLRPVGVTSEQSSLGEARVPSLAQDDVIVEGDIEHTSSRRQLFSDGPIIG